MISKKQLLCILKKSQKPKCYFLNKDEDMVFSLLDGLLTNKERYGYCSAPAVWHLVIMRETGILSVPADTEIRMSWNSGVVTAACMFHGTGTKG